VQEAITLQIRIPKPRQVKQQEKVLKVKGQENADEHMGRPGLLIIQQRNKRRS